jgi:hypothetical protein
VVAGVAAPAVAGNGHGSSATSSSASLRKAVKASSIITHLVALQAAADANGGTRAAGTPGHVASAEYIEQKLQKAGYTTTRQPFSYTKVIVDLAALTQTAPTVIDYAYPDEFYPMDYTASGDVTGRASGTGAAVGVRGGLQGLEVGDDAAGLDGLAQRGRARLGVRAGSASGGRGCRDAGDHKGRGEGGCGQNAACSFDEHVVTLREGRRWSPTQCH